MTAKERILAALSQDGVSLCDGCLVLAADLSRSQVSQMTCTALEKEGTIHRERGVCSRCGKAKVVNRHSMHRTRVGTRLEATNAIREAHAWYWEGNVQSILVLWLANNHYSIIRVADTGSRERGENIVAVNSAGERLLVSVKGYPEDKRSFSGASGAVTESLAPTLSSVGKTNPSTQARHWFSSAVFDIVLYRAEYPDTHLALAFPDGFKTYHNLAARTAWLRNTMPFTIYWVAESGDVQAE